ncbi:WYL domain-containing protein [Enterococcus termitis]
MSEIQKQDDGSLLVTTELPEDDWLYSFLLSLGASVRVVSPLHVEKKLINYIEEMKKNISIYKVTDSCHLLYDTMRL